MIYLKLISHPISAPIFACLIKLLFFERAPRIVAHEAPYFLFREPKELPKNLCRQQP